MILDTSFIIDFMNGEPECLEKLVELKQREKELNVTSLTAYELYLGVRESEKPEKEKNKIKETLQKLSGEKFSFEWIHGKKSAVIQGNLKDEGEMIELQDIFISSIAQKSGQKILTRNHEHFQKIDGVKVESYEAQTLFLSEY